VPRSIECCNSIILNVLQLLWTKVLTAPFVRSRNPVFRIRTLHHTGELSLESALPFDPPCTVSTALHTFGRHQLGSPDRPSTPFVVRKSAQGDQSCRRFPRVSFSSAWCR
jgi:hypothetical protein